jgi:serine/threonine-protein kinase
VLPARTALDPESRERFEREGRLISSLNHPHICVLYDIGVAQGLSPAGDFQYLVMEYLVRRPVDRL